MDQELVKGMIVCGKYLNERFHLDDRLDRLWDRLSPKFQIDKSRVALTRVALTDEEVKLFNILQKGGPCVICGAKGTHVVFEGRVGKTVKEDQSGAFFWKKTTTYLDTRAVHASLCSKHHFKAVFQNVLRKGIMLLAIPSAVLTSYLAFRLDGDGDRVAVAIGAFGIGIIGLVVFGLFFWFLADVVFYRYFPGKDVVWRSGPLQRLRALKWY